MSVVREVDRGGPNVGTVALAEAASRQRWPTRGEQLSFTRGWAAAGEGQARTRLPGLLSYNERAAFVDGWDSFHETQRVEARCAWLARRRMRHQRASASGSGTARL